MVKKIILFVVVAVILFVVVFPFTLNQDKIRIKLEKSINSALAENYEAKIDVVKFGLFPTPRFEFLNTEIKNKELTEISLKSDFISLNFPWTVLWQDKSSATIVVNGLIGNFNSKDDLKGFSSAFKKSKNEAKVKVAMEKANFFERKIENLTKQFKTINFAVNIEKSSLKYFSDKVKFYSLERIGFKVSRKQNNISLNGDMNISSNNLKQTPLSIVAKSDEFKDFKDFKARVFSINFSGISLSGDLRFKDEELNYNYKCEIDGASLVFLKKVKFSAIKQQCNGQLAYKLTTKKMLLNNELNFEGFKFKELHFENLNSKLVFKDAKQYTFSLQGEGDYNSSLVKINLARKDILKSLIVANIDIDKVNLNKVLDDFKTKGNSSSDKSSQVKKHKTISKTDKNLGIKVNLKAKIGHFVYSDVSLKNLLLDADIDDSLNIKIKNINKNGPELDLKLKTLAPYEDLNLDLKFSKMNVSKLIAMSSKESANNISGLATGEFLGEFNSKNNQVNGKFSSVISEGQLKVPFINKFFQKQQSLVLGLGSFFGKDKYQELINHQGYFKEMKTKCLVKKDVVNCEEVFIDYSAVKNSSLQAWYQGDMNFNMSSQEVLSEGNFLFNPAKVKMKDWIGKSGKVEFPVKFSGNVKNLSATISKKKVIQNVGKNIIRKELDKQLNKNKKIKNMFDSLKKNIKF